MKNIDKILFGLLIGAAFPLLFLLIAMIWWFQLDQSEATLPFYLISGMVLGLLADGLFLKDWIRRLYRLPSWFLMALYIVYNIMVFGFFMGFPVFNAFLGMLAGYYAGKRLCHQDSTEKMRIKSLFQVPLFTGLIMALICIPSAYFGLVGEGAGGEIQGMLGLNFTVTKLMIWGIVLIGGVSLIVLDFFLTRYMLIKTLKNL
jgi:hypothetical protein